MKVVTVSPLVAAMACFFVSFVAAPARGQVPAATPPHDDIRQGSTGINLNRPATLSNDSAGHVYAEIETTKGLIEAELDFQRAPLTTLNFVGLAEGTLPFQNRPADKPFFDGLSFHRVVKEFVIQGGDPVSADPTVPPDKLGDGGPGYSVPDEFSPGLRHDAAGILSMANDGPDTNGSQFFITLREVNRLNYLHSVFGQVVRGLEVVNKIEPGDKIVHVTIRRVGPEAEAFHADAAKFESLKQRVLEKRHPVPASFVYLEDNTKQLPEMRIKNFNYKLANYERITGHRIAMRIEPEMKSSTASQNPGSVAKEIAMSLGLPDTGDNLLLCYFAATDVWASRLGEATYPALMGVTGTTEQLMANGVMHEKKKALVAPAQAQTKMGKLKEGVDAAIDTAILTMDDYALKQKASN